MSLRFPISGVGAKDWFKDRMEIQQYKHDLDKDSIVFDLGAYTGTYTDNIFNRYKCNIYSFEPVERFYNVLNQKYKSIDNVHVYKYGLGPDNKNMTLFISGKATSAKPQPNSEQIECQLVNIEEFLVNNNISHIDLMAINIEGGEYDLLEKMSETGLLSCVKTFQIQFHNFDYIPNFEKRRLDIQQHLNKTHDLVYNYDFCWEKWTIRL